MVSILLAKYIM